MIHAEILSEDELTITDRAIVDNVRRMSHARGCTHLTSIITQQLKNAVRCIRCLDSIELLCWLRAGGQLVFLALRIFTDSSLG